MKSMLIGAFFACLQLFSAVLALPACVDHDLVITGDNKLEVYVDGVRQSLTNADDWRKSDTVKVPASAKVIAVHVEDKSFVGGLLASGSGYVTDRSWKCTAALTQGWESPNFDDSTWHEATAFLKHGLLPWGKISGIDNGAWWIWTRKFLWLPFSDHKVYCRKTLPACDPCPGASTGPACITSCEGRPDGDYQSCTGCTVFASCGNGILFDERQGPPSDPPLVWDDILKRFDYESTTCTVCHKA